LWKTDLVCLFSSSGRAANSFAVADVLLIDDEDLLSRFELRTFLDAFCDKRNGMTVITVSYSQGGHANR
jgi:hypothetical protein